MTGGQAVALDVSAGAVAGRAVLLDSDHFPQAVVHAYRDPNGGHPHVVLWADAVRETVREMLSVGRRGEPVMPVPWRQGNYTVWDGREVTFSEVLDTATVLPDGYRATFVAKGASARVCVTCDRPGNSPEETIQSLQSAGLVRGVLSDEATEVRWLHSNITALGLEAPASTPVHELRAGLAHVLGYPSVDALLQQPSYRPLPTLTHGWPRWVRLAPVDRSGLTTLARRVLVHVVSARNTPGLTLADVVASGSLLSSDWRDMAGVHAQPPISIDHIDSGQVYFSLLPGWHDTAPAALVWDDPMRLLGRLDSLGFFVDPVPGSRGPVVDPWGGWRNHTTRDLRVLAADPEGVTQVSFQGGLDLIGVDAPTRIVVRRPEDRHQVIAAYQAHGVTALRGTPLEHAVQIRNSPW